MISIDSAGQVSADGSRHAGQWATIAPEGHNRGHHPGLACLFAILLLLIGAGPSCRSRTGPSFSLYPVAQMSTRTLDRVDLASHPDAPTYRTRLREAEGRTADFAGHYVVVPIGCGTCCEIIVLVDVDDGHVHFAPFATSLGADYQVGSRLLIDSPPEAVLEFYRNNPEFPKGVFESAYYVWDEDTHSFTELSPHGSTQTPTGQ